MHDDVTFEARLADAFGRYADLAPAWTSTAIAARPSQPVGPRAGLAVCCRFDRGGSRRQGRPAPRVA